MHRPEEAPRPSDEESSCNAEASPLGQQRRGRSLNEQHQPDKGTDMGNEPSIPSVTETQQPREEQPTVGLDIPASLIRFNGDFYTMALTADEARDAAWTLLSMAADADRAAQARATLERALDLAAAGISVIPLDIDGKPGIENWEEYQHRRATPEEIRAWFGPESPGAP